MSNKQHEKLTQLYSTWGDKLLQHTDVLYSIQHQKTFKPITVQISLTEACDSKCDYCSVANRPINKHILWNDLTRVLISFRTLGAKSVEFTGGGNPMLYKDGEHNINNAIGIASALGYKVGLITNSHDLSKLSQQSVEDLSWVRVSLSKLDEGKTPSDYTFGYMPYNKLAFSYIIHASTTISTLNAIADLVDDHPLIKFVRFAGDCLIKGNNALVRKKFEDVVNMNDRYKKFFIKTIDEDDGPFDEGCYVGLVRPYIAPSPADDRYMVYVCTSHVLNNRTYDLGYSICSIHEIIDGWNMMNQRFAQGLPPYCIKNSDGAHWCDSCLFCYYKFNNKLLHTVAYEMPDKDFP